MSLFTMQRYNKNAKLGYLKINFYFCAPITLIHSKKTMFTIIALMFAGMLVGFLFRKQRLTGIHRMITLLIWVLLFLLGVEVGGNEHLIQSLPTLGIEAMVLTLAGLLGSLLLAWGLWVWVNRRKEANG